jgi:polysaccharide chain length determinant protein (PEP-CTERM system associated)
MKKARFHNMTDYLAFLVRRKYLILAIAIILAGFATLFARIIPDVYVSQAMILIQQRDIPSEFVKDLVSGDTDQRLDSIEKTILSRTNLLKVLDEFGSRLPQYRGLNDETKVEKLKRQIAINFASEKVQGKFLPVSNITIAYRDHNPDLAQKITQRLTTLFIEQDSRAREAQVFGTTEFLSSELNKIAGQLKESETTLQALKKRYRYELPDERDTNLRTLDRLQLDRNANVEALDRSATKKLNIEQQMSETPRTIPRAQAARTMGAASQPDPSVLAYRQKEQAYKELLGRAKEAHPEVQRLKSELEQLKKNLPAGALEAPQEKAADTEDKASPSDMVPNPAYQNLERQLQEAKTEIEIREREKKWIESQMKNYEQRVDNTPKVEQEIATVLRTNADLTKQHEDLKAKLSEARLSESAESKQKGQQFIVLDPANYPMEPMPPKRSVVLLAGIAISIGLGIGVAFVLDKANPMILTQSELERSLEAKVLIEIPRISSPDDLNLQRKKSMKFAAVFAALAVLYSGFLYLMYLKQSILIKLLDPIFDKIHKT